MPTVDDNSLSPPVHSIVASVTVVSVRTITKKTLPVDIFQSYDSVGGSQLLWILLFNIKD